MLLRSRLAPGRRDHRHLVGAEAGHRRVQCVDRIRVVGLHHLQIADVAARQGSPRVLNRREAAQPHAFLAKQIRRGGGRIRLAGLLGRIGERLLAEHVLAGRDG